MRFSIIVPVFNGEQYLQYCLESVANQTSCDYELLIVDDGSTDNSNSIADAFVARHDNTRVLHGPNQGLLLARRKGLSYCRGEYVIFLDSDDAIAPDALHRISETIDATGADIVSFRYSRSASLLTPNDSASLDSGFYCGETYAQVKQAVLHANFNNLSGKALRLSRVDIDAPYKEFSKLMLAEDLLQLLPIVDASSSLSRIDDVLYYYRPNDASSTRVYRRSYLMDSEVVAHRLLEYGDKWGSPSSALDGALTLYVNVLRLLVRHGTREDIDVELPRISESLRGLSPDVLDGVNRRRPDLRMLLEGAISNNRRKVVLAVHATDAARRLAGRK